VGSGNNGGDGFALACILKEKGYDCCLFRLSSNLSADSAHYAKLAEEANIEILPYTPGCLDGYDILVDCLLGTGFQGKVREPYSTAIEEMNRSDSYVVSVDINSGMNGDTGEAVLAVRSDLTVTIGFVKTGLIAENAGNYIRKLVCTDIGILLAKEEYKICSPAEHLGENCIPCPPWLDMNVQKAY
jgi:NAD(P)H-hydrate epimerase